MWSARPASPVSLTEQYRAHHVWCWWDAVPKGNSQGIREFDLTHACTQTHTQNIRTHTVIGMCNLWPHRYLRGTFSFHSSLPPMYDVLDTEFYTAVYMGSLSVCACVCACVLVRVRRILEVIIVCNGGICFWGSSEWWLCGCLCPYLLNLLCLEFCTCNLSSNFAWVSVTVGMCLSICSNFFFSPYFCSFTHGNFSSFHYCMLSYKTHKAKQSSLHKEDHISHMCELKLRILLCSVFWAVLKCFIEELKWKHGVCECESVSERDCQSS